MIDTRELLLLLSYFLIEKHRENHFPGIWFRWSSRRSPSLTFGAAMSMLETREQLSSVTTLITVEVSIFKLSGQFDGQNACSEPTDPK